MSETKTIKRAPDRAMVERVNAALAKINRVCGAANTGYSLSRPFGDDRRIVAPVITGRRRLVSLARV